MPGPLDGIRIIDFTTMIAGPYATMILADQGADVIKIEAPVRSDHVRKSGHAQRQFSAAFVNNNRNKRSLTVDVKTDAGRSVVRKMAETCDVFVQNFRPGVMARLGIDEPDLRGINSQMIYVSMSGWGEKGPYAHKPVYDPIIQALSGLTTVQGGSDEERPRLIRTILPDKLTGITAAQAISSALVARSNTGVGQHVRLSMLDAIVAFMWSSDMGSQTFVGKEVDVPRAATLIDLIYETKTNYISVSVMSDDQWHGLCRAVEHMEWLDDERFKTPGSRDKYANERLELIQSALLENTGEYWLEVLEKSGVPCAPVLKRSEMIQHPQVQASEIVIQTKHPHAGELRQARNAARFEATDTEIRYGAPQLGEHTRAILKEYGYGADQIDALLSEGAVSDYETNTDPEKQSQ